MSETTYKNLMSQAEKLRRHNRQLAYKSRERYFDAYTRFLRYLAYEYHTQKISNISGKHLEAYVRYMQNKSLAAATIKTELAAIRFWHDQIPNPRFKLPSNESFDLERRKFGDVDRTWSRDEYKGLVRIALEAGRDDYAACIILAWELGLRVHEIMRIDTAIARDTIKNSVLTIKGKGGKVRRIPTNEKKAIDELRRFLGSVPAGEKLFVPKGKDTHIAIKELPNFIWKHRAAVQEDEREAPIHHAWRSAQ